MEKIFYADVAAFPNSIAAVEHILRAYFGIFDGQISRTESGKPYLTNAPRLFFSLSHTKEKLFIAFSDENVGIDAEPCNRECNLPLLLKKFPFEERGEIGDNATFLRHWTVKEAAVKWLGGTLAHDLKKLTFVKEGLRYDGLELPTHITTMTLFGHVVSVCGERDFSAAELIAL